ncbi:cytochrome b/b6 domain-containing protein [Halapricum hydrolyticum]|uniref:Cytochrome b/b6 domain-containing protein n=1 Tax=Halapricum hydrolyticum TaxID=2979991 RepID=A0AAE3LF12_9EURY|nr:cytochrome b/b6 domain-containing protein [Halapricum hydrolyticum]MCU4717691.1 cytochrome b/b6 domain-containing protein [Halapricum hydrolyticum]MCU4726780.1 cytochrome b/b6 domain-containing protein [Halapricum hydrolyticum]
MSGTTDDAGESPAGETGGTSSLLDRGRQLWRTARSDIIETDDRVAQLETAERRPVERHSLGNRLSHWIQAILFFLLLWTGLAIWSGNYFLLESGIWGGYYVAFGIHMWTGILIVAITFVVFPYYYVLVDKHHQLLEMADIQVSFDIAEAFVGLKKYMPYYHDARRAYDEDEGDWIAHHPMQKTFFWWIAIFIGILALTGFGMYREMATESTWWIDALGFMAGWLAFETLKQIHLLLAFITAVMVLFHIYFAALPSNWDVLKSMVFGDVDAFIVHSEHEESTGDQPTTGDGPATAADGGQAEKRESDVTTGDATRGGEPTDE